MIRYTFIECGEWIWGCGDDQCCPDYYQERYRCVSHELELALSISDCHIEALLNTMGLTHYEMDLYDLSLEELENMSFKAGIEVDMLDV